MQAITTWLEALFSGIPFQFLEAWGRFGYLVGVLLMLAAYGGFTFRPGGNWGLGRERQAWDQKAFVAIGLTCVLVPLTGYLGSSVVLVPGAQTFESLKDLMVLLCIVLFGYPALLVVPPVYMLSDLIEGTPPGFILDWLLGYWINPACFWVAYQLIGRNPDFRQLRTWLWYLLFVLVFLGIEPPLWGYICAGKFTAEISYQTITPALFFTTAITFLIAPFAMLGALPLARRYRMFWVEIPGHVKERLLGATAWVWESGRDAGAASGVIARQHWPIRALIAVPFAALLLVMVSAVAFVTLRSGDAAAHALAARLHREIAITINMSVDDYLDPKQNPAGLAHTEQIGQLLEGISIAKAGRIFIVERGGRLVASSNPASNPGTGAVPQSAQRSRDPIIANATAALNGAHASFASIVTPTPFHFDVISAQPLSRETWLAQASPYRDKGGQVDWVVVTAIPEANFLGEIRAGGSQSAMVVALALLLALLTAVWLAGVVTGAIRRISRAADNMAHGDLAQRVARSRLEELDKLSEAFNHMAENLHQAFNINKANEDAIRVHRDSLEELVGQRTRALVTALEREETANRAKSVFLSNMSHELRTPLNAVIGFSRLLSQADNLNDAQRHDLVIINRSGSHLLTLINEVLDLSKIEAGKTPIATADVDLVRLLTDVADMLRPSAEQNGLTLTLALSGPIGAVRADGGKLLQVLINLLGNAIKFTRVGDVALAAHASAPADGQQRLDFSVRDTGIGISSADQQQVFEPFVQMPTHANAAGTGLGLTVARQFVALLGGTLALTSTPGRGSMFSFALTLPVCAPDAQQLAEPARMVSLPVAERGKRVLVADDSADARLLLCRLLEPFGFQVQQAHDGEQAVALAASFEPELIVMDWRMPGLDGVAATGQIRARTEGRQPRIVILSASAFDDERAEALRTGADDFMRKPLEEQQFFAMLEQQLDLHFVRAHESAVAVPVGTPVAALSAAQLAVLPAAVRAALRTACRELDRGKLVATLATIGAEHAALVAGIVRMLDSFAYRELWELLGGESDASA